MLSSKAALGKTQATQAPPLEILLEHLDADMKAVNAIILARMQSDVALIPQLAGHLIASGGKRIRPLLTLACADLAGYRGDRQHKLAACVEFIHTATLLHDDVVDESEQRRGQASANAIFGNEAAVLVGDFLFSRAFQLMVEDGSLDVLRILSNASAVIAEGEVLQLSTTRNITTTQQDYIDVITSKTAELFASACEVGGVIAHPDDAEKIEALRNYGLALGIAFQIADDILDYTIDAAGASKLGKATGDDFKEGKITAPVMLALTKASAEEKEFWQRTLEQLDQQPQDFLKAVEILKKHNAFQDSQKLARDYAARASKALDIFAASPMRDALKSLAEFSAARDY